MSGRNGVNFSVNLETSIKAEGYDAIVVVASSLDDLQGDLEDLLPVLKTHAEIDQLLEKESICLSIRPLGLSAKRVVYSPTGSLNKDGDDVRKFGDAAEAGIKRVLKSGAVSPLFVVVPSKLYAQSSLVGLLGALHALYVPLEIKEDVPKKAKKVEKLGFIGDSKVLELALALESGRIVARDIGGSDPERMAPPKVEEYVRKIFSGSNIILEVVDDDSQLCKEYPLFAAVNRGAKLVERHRGRIIYLTYTGQGPIQKTLLIVGKGVTYDTGGADVKAGGCMAGMHRDKCGSAAVAGFMETLKRLSPPNIKVIAAMAMVRNSIGSNCYVADEIITSRAGVRIRIGNTDAEGRMAMGDVLCVMKEKALNEVNPFLMTIATLTGHACLAYGDGYTAIMDNGPASLGGVARNVASAGEEIADLFEISTIRREDYQFHEGKSEYEDVLQCNNLASSRTPRGHQSPAAFLVLASGLDKHGKDSNQPLKYSHIDIAASSGPFPGVPTGAPILALSKAYLPSLF